jgi:hypothetical protein
MSKARVDIAISKTCVDILDADTGEVVDYCFGLTRDGRCPNANRDGIVPCNGRRVAASREGPEFWLVWVPPASRHCPLAWNLDKIGY